MKEFDLLIVMGGSMSACHGADDPWLAYEKQFIHRAIDAGKSVLGICCGELIPSKYVQTEEEILSLTDVYIQNSRGA